MKNTGVVVDEATTNRKAATNEQLCVEDVFAGDHCGLRGVPIGGNTERERQWGSFRVEPC